MVDVALDNGTAMPAVEQADRARVLQRLRLGDIAFRHLTRGAAITVLLILGGIILSLLHGAWPALSKFGFGFLTTEVWNPVTEKFGAVAPIYGTLVTSLIAMLIAVPVGLFIAMFLTELCPMWLRRPIGIAIELLAGILALLDEGGPQLVQFLVAELFGLDEAIVGAAQGVNQLVQLGLHGFAIAILGVLEDEHHEEGDDGGGGVDHQLPGLGIAEYRSGHRPQQNQDTCGGEGHRLAGQARNGMGKAQEQSG